MWSCTLSCIGGASPVRRPRLGRAHHQWTLSQEDHRIGRREIDNRPDRRVRWNLERVASEIDSHLGGSGVTASLLSAWERGTRRTQRGTAPHSVVARMYQEPGLVWLERQAEVAEDLVAERQAAAERHR
jgi:hypothetical protein